MKLHKMVAAKQSVQAFGDVNLFVGNFKQKNTTGNLTMKAGVNTSSYAYDLVPTATSVLAPKYVTMGPYKDEPFPPFTARFNGTTITPPGYRQLEMPITVDFNYDFPAFTIIKDPAAMFRVKFNAGFGFVSSGHDEPSFVSIQDPKYWQLTIDLNDLIVNPAVVWIQNAIFRLLDDWNVEVTGEFVAYAAEVKALLPRFTVKLLTCVLRQDNPTDSYWFWGGLTGISVEADAKISYVQRKKELFAELPFDGCCQARDEYSLFECVYFDCPCGASLNTCDAMDNVSL